MKKSLALALICLVFTFSPLFAEVKAGPHWDGELETTSWYLDNITDFDSDAGDQMAFLSTYFNLNMEMNLEDGVDLVMGLKIEQVLGNTTWNAFQDTLALRKAYVQLNNFLWEPVTLVVGRQVDAYALLGDESKGSFMFDSNEMSNSGGVDGFKVILNLDNIITNIFMYNYSETSTDAVTPAIAGDDAVMGVQATWDLNTEGTNRLYGMILADRRGAPNAFGIGDNRVGTNALSLNLGASWGLSDTMFIYGQLASNLSGFYWDEANDGDGYLTNDNERQDVKGLAVQIGMDFQFGAYGAWFQIDYATGDDPTTAEYEGFIAPGESQELLYIIEGQNTLNRSSNYTAIRLGGTWSIRGDLELGLTLGIVSAVDDTAPGALVGAGTEFDFVVNWEYSDNVVLSALVGAYMPDSDNVSDDMVVAGLGKASVRF